MSPRRTIPSCLVKKNMYLKKKKRCVVMLCYDFVIYCYVKASGMHEDLPLVEFMYLVFTRMPGELP